MIWSEVVVNRLLVTLVVLNLERLEERKKLLNLRQVDLLLLKSGAKIKKLSTKVIVRFVFYNRLAIIIRCKLKLEFRYIIYICVYTKKIYHIIYYIFKYYLNKLYSVKYFYSLYSVKCII